MQDLKRIGADGWTNPSVGVVNWYGILGRGSASVNERVIQSVEPVLQEDGLVFLCLADHAG
ncbi:MULTISPECIES: hypothetical protein [unclassified Polaromonas]|uniref:hypothetical protein n=1 Tax=unclassified Polaromonas TaxID=2638319 RepID=UPI0018CBBE00|nr:MULTISPECIES: hypothetical protein [unclassified Polaromonas]MBG6071996.1 hypothetical protein [Polaromonas sp. CG_9.7]MBG6113998.1 hypothetical protein [Polaromonas sp. CG_9.2]MDH6184917.1 hypothetical protein [Polaromonas sp. CG_23.6]